MRLLFSFTNLHIFGYFSIHKGPCQELPWMLVFTLNKRNCLLCACLVTKRVESDLHLTEPTISQNHYSEAEFCCLQFIEEWKAVSRLLATKLFVGRELLA